MNGPPCRGCGGDDQNSLILITNEHHIKTTFFYLFPTRFNPKLCLRFLNFPFEARPVVEIVPVQFVGEFLQNVPKNKRIHILS